MNAEQIAFPKDFERSCPVTCKAFLARKFVLPNYRAPDYYNQDHLNRLALLLLTLPFTKESADDVVRSQMLNTYQALHCDRPILFLERELGEILVKTEIPGIVEVSDIHFPFPFFRAMLPKELIGLPSQKRWEPSWPIDGATGEVSVRVHVQRSH